MLWLIKTDLEIFNKLWDIEISTNIFVKICNLATINKSMPYLEVIFHDNHLKRVLPHLFKSFFFQWILVICILDLPWLQLISSNPKLPLRSMTYISNIQVLCLAKLQILNIVKYSLYVKIFQIYIWENIFPIQIWAASKGIEILGFVFK